MLGQIKNYLNKGRIKRIFDLRNVGLYIFAVIVLAITWSGIKTVQNNYDLQKKISVLKQQNDVLQLQNENSNLKNQYFQTDQYADLTARQNLGLAAPGEKVLLIPKSVALKYADSSLVTKSAVPALQTADNRSKYVKNLEDWRDFLLGRKLTSN